MAAGSRENVYVEIGALVRHHRQGRGLTQSQLAERADISVEFVGRIERGQAAPALGTLLTIAEALDVPISAFFRLGSYEAGSPTSEAMSRLVLRLSTLDQAELDWVDNLVRVALARQPRRRATN